MNDLELVTCKISSAREILDSAIDALESDNHEKAMTMMYATDEFLQYYLKEFDVLFKVAWKETVSEMKNLEYNTDTTFLAKDRNSNFPSENTICNNDNESEECKSSWISFWDEDGTENKN